MEYTVFFPNPKTAVHLLTARNRHGEGCALFLLKQLNLLVRNATVLAEIVGVCSTFDPNAAFGDSIDSEAVAAAIKGAIEQAKIVLMTSILLHPVQVETVKYRRSIRYQTILEKTLQQLIKPNCRHGHQSDCHHVRAQI